MFQDTVRHNVVAPAAIITVFRSPSSAFAFFPVIEELNSSLVDASAGPPSNWDGAIAIYHGDALAEVA